MSQTIRFSRNVYKCNDIESRCGENRLNFSSINCVKGFVRSSLLALINGIEVFRTITQVS